VSDRAVLSLWILVGKLKDAKQSYVSHTMVGTLHTGIHNINCSKEFTIFQIQTTTSKCSGISRRVLNTRLYEHIRHDIQHVWPDDDSKCFWICGSYFHVEGYHCNNLQLSLAFQDTFFWVPWFPLSLSFHCFILISHTSNISAVQSSSWQGH